MSIALGIAAWIALGGLVSWPSVACGALVAIGAAFATARARRYTIDVELPYRWARHAPRVLLSSLRSSVRVLALAIVPREGRWITVDAPREEGARAHGRDVALLYGLSLGAGSVAASIEDHRLIAHVPAGAGEGARTVRDLV